MRIHPSNPDSFPGPWAAQGRSEAPCPEPGTHGSHWAACLEAAAGLGGTSALVFVRIKTRLELLCQWMDWGPGKRSPLHLALGTVRSPPGHSTQAHYQVLAGKGAGEEGSRQNREQAPGAPLGLGPPSPRGARASGFWEPTESASPMPSRLPTDGSVRGTVRPPLEGSSVQGWGCLHLGPWGAAGPKAWGRGGGSPEDKHTSLVRGLRQPRPARVTIACRHFQSSFIKNSECNTDPQVLGAGGTADPTLRPPGVQGACDQESRPPRAPSSP